MTLLLLGFAALPIRGVLFAVIPDPYLLVVVQLLDGVSAAVFGVMVPRLLSTSPAGPVLNLALGIVGTAIGIGASLSTTPPDISAITSAAELPFSDWRSSPLPASC